MIEEQIEIKVALPQHEMSLSSYESEASPEFGRNFYLALPGDGPLRVSLDGFPAARSGSRRE